VHVHHGLSANADRWTRFCRDYCRSLGVPLIVKRVAVAKRGKGLEAAAREARYGAFKSLPVDIIALAHQLDDQAETVLMNLLRGAGRRGASGMPAERAFHGKRLARPLLDVPRESILAYAKQHCLGWVEDESNADEALTRNFLRRRVAPLLAERFPRWREALARAARHFARAELDAAALVRAFLAERGLRAPSEAKLADMVKQLAAARPRTLIEHDGVRFRLARGALVRDSAAPGKAFAPIAWRGERRLALPDLGGELVFRRARGEGIDPRFVAAGAMHVRRRRAIAAGRPPAAANAEEPFPGSGHLRLAARTAAAHLPRKRARLRARHRRGRALPAGEKSSRARRRVARAVTG
jgi:tRNA(Ile)-lysidine synthase